MKIQPISQNNYYNRINIAKPQQRNDYSTDSLSFKGNFEQVMDNVIRKDLLTRGDVESAMSKLYFAAIEEPGIIRREYQPLLTDWLAVKGTYLIEELCKPIAKVRSDFRDIIFKSQGENIPILSKGDDDLIYIMNLGKHGFWNTIFENESATNDMKIVFMSKTGCFEVGTNKKGKLVSEQSMHTGPWTKNTYNMFMGDRIAQKSGNASDTIIWPAF